MFIEWFRILSLNSESMMMMNSAYLGSLFMFLFE
jgi:hypothetical protein